MWTSQARWRDFNMRGTRVMVFAFIFGVLALAFSIVASNTCLYLTIDLTTVNPEELPPVNNFGMGLWQHEGYYQNEDGEWTGSFGCVGWTRTELDAFTDGMWKAARGMGMAAVFLAAIALILVACLSFTDLDPKYLSVTCLVCVFAGIFQGLSFLAFATDGCKAYGCSFSRGAGFAIGAILSFFIEAAILAAVPRDGLRGLATSVTSNQPTTNQAKNATAEPRENVGKTMEPAAEDVEVPLETETSEEIPA